VILLDGTGAPASVADTAQFPVNAGGVGCAQLTVITGVGCGVTLTMVCPDPIAMALLTVTVTDNLPVNGAGYVHVVDPVEVGGTAVPFPQSHEKFVGGGAPFCGITVAVRFVLFPVMTVEGDAVSVTL
jgi:hypothetical protein